jgi:cell fate regulator YaaT (PSP1 superfamily)
MKIKIVGVRFRPAGKIYYFKTNDLEIAEHAHVIVETAQGIEYGEVVLGPREIEKSTFKHALKPVKRIATKKDEQTHTELRQKEKEARQVFEERAAFHHLDMHLVDVEFTFDHRKAIFYFTADGRLDFRQLVRDLASAFHLRIELRQIGVRDETKMFNTLGICGRETCCSSWMGEFRPVSIKMAKEQGLSLNSTKISGVCGRLLCCLTYEDPFYHEVTRKMPKIGNWVTTPDGEGQVYRLNVLEEKVVVKMQTEDDEMEIKTFDVNDVVKSGEKHVLANNRRQQREKEERLREQKQEGQDGKGEDKGAHKKSAHDKGQKKQAKNDGRREEGHRKRRHRAGRKHNKRAKQAKGGDKHQNAKTPSAPSEKSKEKK